MSSTSTSTARSNLRLERVPANHRQVWRKVGKVREELGYCEEGRKPCVRADGGVPKKDGEGETADLHEAIGGKTGVLHVPEDPECGAGERSCSMGRRVAD